MSETQEQPTVDVSFSMIDRMFEPEEVEACFKAWLEKYASRDDGVSDV